jgi:hypothetical protein
MGKDWRAAPYFFDFFEDLGVSTLAYEDSVPAILTVLNNFPNPLPAGNSTSIA